MNNLKIIKQEDNVFNCEALPSVNFDNTIREAIDFVKIYQTSVVKYHFNDILIAVDKDSTLATITKLYNEESSRKYQERINSDEYKQEKKENAEREKKYQAKTQEVLNSFDQSLESTSTLIKWIGEFANAYENSPVPFNKKEVAEKMKANGYDYEIPSESEKSKLDEKSRLEVGIIANAYKSLSNNEAINHVAYDFSLKYEELDKKENVIKNIKSIRNKEVNINVNKKYSL